MQINVIKYSPSALAAIETALNVIQNRCSCTIYETPEGDPRLARIYDIFDQVDLIRVCIDDMQAKSLLPNSPGATSEPLSVGLRPMF